MPDWYMEEMRVFKMFWDEEKELAEEDWKGGDDEYIFHPGNGIPYTPQSATSTWAKIKKKHQLKNIRLHDLRHTMVTYLLESGESILNVQNRAGHSSSKITTDTYGHVTKRASKSTAKRFNKFDPRQFVNNSSTTETLSTSPKNRNVDIPRFSEDNKTGSG